MADGIEILRQRSAELIAVEQGQRIEIYFRDFNDLLIRSPNDNSKSHCTVCECDFTATQPGHIKQHFNSKKHKLHLDNLHQEWPKVYVRALGRVKDTSCYSVEGDRIKCGPCMTTLKPVVQTLNEHLNTISHKEACHIQQYPHLYDEDFHLQVCATWIALEFPFNAMKRGKKQLEKLFRRRLLDESTYRKIYMPKLFQKVQAKVKEIVQINSFLLFGSWNVSRHQRS